MKSFIALVSAIMVFGFEVFSSSCRASQGNAQVGSNNKEQMFYDCCKRLERWQKYTIVEWFDMEERDPERYNNIVDEIEQRIQALKSIEKYRYSGCRTSLKKLRNFLKMSNIALWIKTEVNELAKVLCIGGSSEDWARAVQQIKENKSERDDYDHFQEFIEFTRKYHRRYTNSFTQGKPVRFLKAVLDASTV